MKNKKKPDSGSGGVQYVDVDSTKEEIKDSLVRLADTIESIHILKRFPKIKQIGNGFIGCMFCKFKGGNHPLCNDKNNQDRQLLIEHK